MTKLVHYVVTWLNFISSLGCKDRVKPRAAHNLSWLIELLRNYECNNCSLLLNVSHKRCWKRFHQSGFPWLHFSKDCIIVKTGIISIIISHLKKKQFYKVIRYHFWRAAMVIVVIYSTNDNSTITYTITFNKVN